MEASQLQIYKWKEKTNCLFLRFAHFVERDDTFSVLLIFFVHLPRSSLGCQIIFPLFIPEKKWFTALLSHKKKKTSYWSSFTGAAKKSGFLQGKNANMSMTQWFGKEESYSQVPTDPVVHISFIKQSSHETKELEKKVLLPKSRSLSKEDFKYSMDFKKIIKKYTISCC